MYNISFESICCKDHWGVSKLGFSPKKRMVDYFKMILFGERGIKVNEKVIKAMEQGLKMK